MNRSRQLLAAILAVVFSIVMAVGSADAQGKGKGKGKEGSPAGSADGQGKEKGKEKHHHKSGKQLVGEKIKTNGHHVIDQNGKHTVSVDVKNGKIAGVHVKHSEKGEVPVKKYKTTKKMASRSAERNGISLVSYRGMLPQVQDMGTVYIGYAYIDDYGDEYIYWFPYEMIYDGDSGAVEYIPLN